MRWLKLKPNKQTIKPNKPEVYQFSQFFSKFTDKPHFCVQLNLKLYILTNKLVDDPSAFQYLKLVYSNNMTGFCVLLHWLNPIENYWYLIALKPEVKKPPPFYLAIMLKSYYFNFADYYA